MAWDGVTGTFKKLASWLDGGAEVSFEAGDLNIGNVDVASIAAGETHIGSVGGHIAVAADEFTRPADTNAYAAKDAVADSDSAPTALNFADVARANGGTGYITKAQLLTSQTTNTARYRLHLYTESITAVNDNAAQTVLYANRADYVGYVDFPAATTDGSDTAHSQNADVRLPFFTESDDADLYGYLETLDAFTPASAQTYFISLTADQN